MKKSLKGKLVRAVMKEFSLKHLFAYDNGEKVFQENLQAELDNHLKFKTEVCEVKHILTSLTGRVVFEDEYSKDRCIDFTISPKAIISK